MKNFQFTKLAVLASCTLFTSSIASGQLRVDFSLTGATPEPGFEGYFADHEVNATFITQSYTAFGATVSITPFWGDDDPTLTVPINGTPGNVLTGERTSKQLIVRTNDSPSPALYQDWIGTDTRGGTRRPGNPLRLVLSGLPAGSYLFRSHHHDPGGQTGLIDITVGDQASVEFDQSGEGGLTATPAIFEGQFTTNGATDVELVYSNRAASEGRNQGSNDFTMINAIEIFVDPDSEPLREINITSSELNESGDLSISYTGLPLTEYQIAMSLSLDNDFARFPLRNNTDDAGNGSFFLPAAFLPGDKAFFRVEQANP